MNRKRKPVSDRSLVQLDGLSFSERYERGRAAGRTLGSQALSTKCEINYAYGVIHGALERLEEKGSGSNT